MAADQDFDDLVNGEPIKVDDELLADMLALAEDAAEYARSIAPVGDPNEDPHSGAYRDNIVVEQKGNNVYVAFNDPKSHWIEYGTEHMPEYAIRARTEEHFNQ